MGRKRRILGDLLRLKTATGLQVPISMTIIVHFCTFFKGFLKKSFNFLQFFLVSIIFSVFWEGKMEKGAAKLTII